MTTPFSIDGMQGDYAQTRYRLDMVASTLGMHFGNNYLWELMIDGILNAHDSKIHLGKVLRLPSQIERTSVASFELDAHKGAFHED